MRKRFAAGLLAATAVAAGFMLPAQASGRHVHVALRSNIRAVHAGKSAGSAAAPGVISWTAAATMPTAVEETGGGAAIQNSFYVIGGFTSFNPVTVVNNVQLYSKTANTWSTKAPIPGAGGGWADAAFCVNPADKTIHVVNGVDGQFLYSAHQVYNTVTDTWTFASAPVLSTGAQFFSQDSGCAFIGGKMYLFGGYGIVTPTQPSAVIENITWVYDPATDTWSDTTLLMQHPRLWMGYTGNTTNAFAAGGTDNISTFTPIASTEKFTPATGWAATGNLPTALLAPGEGNVKTHLLVWGGRNSSLIAQLKTYGCTLPNCTAFATTAFNMPQAKDFFAFGSGTSVYSGGGDTGSGTPVNTAEHLP